MEFAGYSLHPFRWKHGRHFFLDSHLCFRAPRKKVFLFERAVAMSQFRTLAVVGVTGAVGRIVLQELEKRNLDVQKYVFLASKRSAGKQIQFKGETYTIGLMCPEAFDQIDVAIASTPDEVAAEFTPWAVERNCVVIDESNAHRMLDHVPLVIPEVNAHAVDQHQGIIASPNCSTTQMVVALKPIQDAVGLKRVIVSTYQSTSGAGVAGQQELANGMQASLNGEKASTEVFGHPIAGNLIPQIGSHKEDGYTSEEMKMVYETRKIMGDEEIQVCPTCVRVPVTIGHSESILVETERPLSVQEATELFREAEGVTVVDDLSTHSYPMPRDCDGKDDVFVGRIRKDISSENGIAFWCVSDNLRKGAATNAVQIAELLVRKASAVSGQS